LDLPNRKIRAFDVNLGQTKRIVKCICASESENVFYCGTTSGDILEISYPMGTFKSIGPEKNKFSLGVTSLRSLKNGDLIVGSGDGRIVLLDPANKFKTKMSAQCDAEVTSISLRGVGHMFFVGTAKSQIYRLELSEWKQELLNTCHNGVINDIIFPL
jgi:cilia- and flagella-associated protein 52